MSRKKQITTFLSVFALILGATHFYIFWRSSYYLQLDSQAQTFLELALTILAILTLIALPLSRLLPRNIASLITKIVFPWMGIGLLLFTGFVITDIIWLSLNLFSLYTSYTLSLSLQKTFGVVLLTLITSLCIYALWNGLFFVRTRFVNIRLKKLSPALNGLKIVQLTDIHIGPMRDGKWLQKIVNRVNKLDADIIAITGDLVDGSVPELASHIAELTKLKAKYGVYFVTGNHEYYSGADEWCEHLQKIGIDVLRNKSVSLKINGDTVNLAGVDDWSSRHFAKGHNISTALASCDKTKPIILLAHQPITMHEAAAAYADLQLSGHTHGGQIWPFKYLVYLQQPVSHGLFQYPNSNLQVYVNQGTGFWGPPMRLGTFAEISCLILENS